MFLTNKKMPVRDLVSCRGLVSYRQREFKEKKEKEKVTQKEKERKEIKKYFY